MIQIKTRLLEVSDAPLLFQLMTSEKWLKYIGDRGINTLIDTENYIRSKMHSDLSVKGFINHVILDAETGDEVGTCSIHNREGVDGLDIGYAILEKYEGKGYATAAAGSMVNKAFNDYGIDKVSAITTDENVGSCRVLEKLGFKHQGYLKLSGSDEELRLYELKS
jgi:RimJ/RimL family protein N-acetyltransferase